MRAIYIYIYIYRERERERERERSRERERVRDLGRVRAVNARCTLVRLAFREAPRGAERRLRGRVAAKGPWRARGTRGGFAP